MIDSTKSPVPAWKRYATIALLAMLTLAAVYVLYTKELHHNSAGSSPVPATVSRPVQPVHSASQKSTPTTIPGGIPISSRNPFQ